ncbi:MAG: acyltransferase family protein, partial [Chitinivibrionales bacterium]|nr:acyltransferase family protein [Chitinivibrionales bacterium]
MTAISPYLSRKIAILSFVSIILVVFIHAKTVDFIAPTGSHFYAVNFLIQNFIIECIARIAVPLFFAFSGFLFFATLTPTPAGFKKKLSSRLRTLVVPYLLWNCMGLLLLLVLQSMHGNVSFSGEKLIRSYTIVDFLGRIYPHPVQFQFWFLLDLAVYFIASPLLYVLLKLTGPVV